MKVDIVLDIETLTIPATAQDVELAIASYQPPKGYKKASTIEAHRQKFIENAVQEISKTRRFSLSGKRMISCALGIADYDKNKVIDIECYASEDLSIITSAVVNYLNENGDYRLITFNGKKFDIPELLKSFRLTGLRPKRRVGKWDMIDLIHTFPEGGLKKTCEAFGIETIGNNGAQVQEMYDRGDWESIKAYNADDVRITGELYLAASAILTF